MRYVLIAIVVCLLSSFLCAGESPSEMTQLVVRMTGTSIPEDSFGAKPKRIWRSGIQYCRIEEEADPERGIHANVIINEPDIWMVNLADKTARHFLDEGSTLNCRLPIFATDAESAKGKLGELEFGHEFEFFSKNGAKVVDGPKWPFDVEFYQVEVGDNLLSLIVRADSHAPIRISLNNGKTFRQVQYLAFDLVPFKADLFAKPTGVTIEEPKPAPAK